MFLSNERKSKIREMAKDDLISRNKLIEYLKMQIKGAHNLKDKEKFPGNTDETVQYFDTRIEAYEELIKHLNYSVNHSELLRLLVR